jgi:5'-deoxynucleotidase YfbR-like HD superfamily hydrolase
MSLGARIQKLEVVAAPIKAEMERRRKNQRLREEILSFLKDRIENSLVLSRYVHGADLDEQETTKDIVEMDLLYQHEAMSRYGIDENEHFNATTEQLAELSRETAMRIDRHFFNTYLTVEQNDKEQEQWRQARADMEAGLPSAESEAAEYLRQLFKRYPRKPNAERFYNIWD